MNNHDLYQIIYISAAAQNFKVADLESLLRKTHVRNKERGITGLILHVDGNIIQVIEGPRDIVEALFSKIEFDPRHRHVTVLGKRVISERDFPAFTMGFKRSDRDEIENQIPGFIESVENGYLRQENMDGLSSRVKIILRSFAQTTQLELE